MTLQSRDGQDVPTIEAVLRCAGAPMFRDPQAQRAGVRAGPDEWSRAPWVERRGSVFLADKSHHGPQRAPQSTGKAISMTHEQDTAPHRNGFFYWQLPADELKRLRADNSILEDEGYLAHDINWGRRLLDLRADPTSVPDVTDDWAGPPTIEHVSDAISAILQVAVDMGADPEQVCAAALFTHRGVRRGAAESAAHHRSSGL